MSRARTIILTLGALVALALLGGMGAAAWVLWDMPTPQGERIRGPNGLIGIQAGGSYAWVVPTTDGVLLVDAGLDPQAAAIRREIGSRTVHAVLLTHAHGDHVAGLKNLTEFPVYVGPDARSLLLGEHKPGGWLAGWFAALMGSPPVPDTLIDVADGQVLTIDGVSIRAVHVPGHTLGSTAWLWEDVLFSGDALLTGSPPVLPPEALSTDPLQAKRSLERLLPLDFDWLADGHSGVLSGARSAVFRLVGEKVVPPTITVRDPEKPGVDAGPAVSREGVYAQAPLPGPDGLQPAILILDDGTEWLLSATPNEGHRTYWGRKVIVEGHMLAPGAEPGRPAGIQVALDGLRLAEGETEGNGALPELDSGDAMSDHVGEWARIMMHVDALQALDANAAWGEGHGYLPDDTQLVVSAPIGIPIGHAQTYVGRVQRTGDALHVIISAACPVDGLCP